MNIIKLQNQLRSPTVTLQDLVGYVQDQQGPVPSYLALAELSRRKKLSAEGAQQAPAPTESVASQEVAEAEPGIASLPLQDSSMFSEQSMAGGGIVAFGGGGDVPSYASQGSVRAPAYMSSPVGKYFNPADLANYNDAEIQKLLKDNPYLSLDDIYKQQETARTNYGIKNIYADQTKALEEDKAENEKFKSANEADALLNAAAGFLGNTSPFFGPGAEAALRGYTTTKREGQKEYRANARDIRNLGFEIGRSDQAMRQALMSGDQSLFNSERARHEALQKEARDVNYKNADAKNSLLVKGADAAAGYKTNTDVAAIREAGDDARARAKSKSDLQNKAQDNATTIMRNKYPLGLQDPTFTREAIQPGKGPKDAQALYDTMLADITKQQLISMAAEQGVDPTEILNATNKTTSTLTPVPADKKQLVTGTVYNTARGPARWDGKQFVAQ